MQIVTYPHPTLRYKSKAIRHVDAELKMIIRQMFALMYEAKGIGLAANQVDLPLRIFVINTSGNPDEGEEMVFLNPVIVRTKGIDESEEGCLSIPGVYGDVVRPKMVRVNAFTPEGTEIDAEIDGLLARVIQHELDHLDGVLFPDRMAEAARADVESAMEELAIDFESKRKTGSMPADDVILRQLMDWELKYC